MIEKRRLIYTCCIIVLLLSACTSEKDDLDRSLRFAINTAQGSRGIDYYKLPEATDLKRIPQDPQNPLTAAKVRLGQQLFFETGFATEGRHPDFRQTYSCASCHHPAGGFQSNIRQGIGEGGIGFGIAGEGRKASPAVSEAMIDVLPLRVTSVLNSAFQSNVMWNGQYGAKGVNRGTEQLWSQNPHLRFNILGFEGVETRAIAGLSTHRHRIDSEQVKALGYQQMFDQAFSNMPESQRYVMQQGGLAIAAYQRTLLASKAPFQQWLRGDYSAMSEGEKEGAKLFFKKAKCVNCHNGPSLANMDFHAIGLDDFDPDQVLNTQSGDPAFLGRGSYTNDPKDNYKFKVPQLYNLKDVGYYGHGASFSSIRDIIAYKNAGIAQNTNVPEAQLSPFFEPLGLTEEEVDLLTLFIERALYDPDLKRYEPSSVASGSCIPNNDWLSRIDLNCD